jgi:hypothetical protein
MSEYETKSTFATHKALPRLSTVAGGPTRGLPGWRDELLGPATADDWP